MSKKPEYDELAELIKTLLIVQLRVAGYGQKQIRDVIGCDVNRVSAVLKHMKRPKTDKAE